MRSRHGIAAAGAVLLLLPACVGPARTEADYRADASNAAKTAISALESAQLTVQTVVDGKASAVYASLRLTEDEGEAEAAIVAFGSVQPPNEEMQRLRADVLGLLQQANTLLADLRIAAFRGDHGHLDAIAQPLQPTADKLQRYEHPGR
ncbi:MAG: hypothetical protein GEU74_02960 [Nitriliruptorales bacterium]|nr:hypothetical protein [Nitriliruptorales bacterium]